MGFLNSLFHETLNSDQILSDYQHRFFYRRATSPLVSIGMWWIDLQQLLTRHLFCRAIDQSFTLGSGSVNLSNKRKKNSQLGIDYRSGFRVTLIDCAGFHFNCILPHPMYDMPMKGTRPLVKDTTHNRHAVRVLYCSPMYAKILFYNTLIMKTQAKKKISV